MPKNPSVDLKMGSKACFHDGWFLNPEVSFLLTFKSLTDYGRYLTRTTGNYTLLKYVRVRCFTETQPRSQGFSPRRKALGTRLKETVTFVNSLFGFR